MGISIKEPCHEDWAKMTSTEKGAFCQKCAKDVINFTGKTSFEIKSILSQELNQETVTCGRITNYQMDQINDEFFQWKSDRESFRAVWMFSLIAVFGLTLFSCQNNLSKELVNKLNTEAATMIDEEDSTVVETAPIDSSDRIPVDVAFDSSLITTTDVPWLHETEWMGIMPYEPQIISTEWIICEAWMGDMIVIGSIIIPEEETEIIKRTGFWDAPSSNNQEIRPTTRFIRPKTNSNSNHLEGITSGSKKIFDSFIYPNPIDVTSRVYLDTKEQIDLSFTVHPKEDRDTTLRSGNQSFTTGNHEIDIKLYKFDKGEYLLRLACEKQVSVLEFEVT